jgi:hypothetical protein
MLRGAFTLFIKFSTYQKKKNTWRVAWNTSPVSTFSEFLALCFFLYGLGVLLYISCVFGLHTSTLLMNIHYLSIIYLFFKCI